MNCIDCNTKFVKFVHNQTRCRECVSKRNILDRNKAKELKIKFERACNWCSCKFEMTGPASKYCSRQCHLDFKRAKVYKLNYDSYCELTSKKVCDLCESDGFQMNSSYDSGLVIDHCHTTGIVRGMLCHNCNRALGLMQDNTSVLKKAISYLESATTIPKGSTPKQVEAQSSLTN